MRNFILFALCISILSACTGEMKHEKTAETVAVESKMQPAEFADLKYAEIGKKMLASLSKGDMTGYMADFAENAVYQWNNGDSLAGKQAITDYWTKRRTEMVDSLAFSNEIWLPVKVNQPQSVEAPGVWALGWYQIYIRYKNGKSVVQWMHLDLHFDQADKIDRVVQYLDRAPINAALAN